MRQPWLNDDAPPGRAVPDDFSPRSATMPVRRAALVLGVAYLLLLAGRSPEILDAAYGLPIAPGTSALIEAAEVWNGALEALGVPEALGSVRAVLAKGR